MHYDYLIVGAGLFGAVFAHRAVESGRSCLVIDRRPNVGGNVYTENVEGINVHVYGAHIFHTSDEEVWRFVNRFASFNGYVNRVVADYNGERYSLPFNMYTFEQLWGVRTPEEARAKIAEQIAAYGIDGITNLEQQAISMVGTDVYLKLVKGYTEKQWGRSCGELPPPSSSGFRYVSPTTTTISTTNTRAYPWADTPRWCERCWKARTL